jgi:hypothetical protein
LPSVFFFFFFRIVFKKACPNRYDSAANATTNSRASIWKVKDILELAAAQNVTRTGALIAGVFDYACDFNTGLECFPKVSFRRIDDPTSNSSGFNYRRTVYSDTGAVRDLYKWFGLRLVLITTGYGKKFVTIVPAIQNFGAGIALVAVATLIADFLVEYVLPHRAWYKKSKVKEVDDPSGDELDKNQEARALMRKDSEDQLVV